MTFVGLLPMPYSNDNAATFHQAWVMNRSKHFSPAAGRVQQAEQEIQRDTHIALAFLALGGAIILLAIFWV